MRLLFYLFVLFSFGVSHAQTWRTNADKADSLRRSGAYEASIPLYKKVLSSLSKSDAENRNIYTIRIGLSYLYHGENEHARKQFVRVLNATQKDTLNILRGHAYNNLGLLYVNQGAHRKSIRNYRKALAIYERNKHAYLRDLAKMNIGKVQEKIGEYQEAIRMISSSIEGFISRGDSVNIGEAYSSLGIIQENMGNNAKALYYYKQSAVVRKQIHDPFGLASAYNNVGGAFRLLGAPDSALVYFKKSLAVTETTSDRNIALTYHNMALLYKEQNQLALARSHFQLALESKRKYKDQREIAFTLNALGAFEIDAGQYKKAHAYLSEATNILKEIRNSRVLQANYTQWKEYFKKTENLDSALYYLEQSTLLQQQINEREYLEQVADLHMTFDVDQKENQIGALAKTTETQRKDLKRVTGIKDSLQGWMFIIITALIFVAASFIIYRQRSKRKVLESRVAGIEQEKQRVSMELHEASGVQIRTILNELHSVNLGNNQTQSLIQKTTMLGDEIRLISHSLHHPQLETTQFNTLVEDTIFDWQTEQNIKVCVILEAIEWLNSLPLEYRSHIYRFLQESLLNIQKHATAGNVSVIFKKQNDQFQMIVKNESVQVLHVSKPGIGIENLKTRAQLMQGEYHFKCDANCSESVLQIPINLN